MRLIAALVFVLLLPTVVIAQPAGTLVVGLVAEPVALDPAQVTDLNSNRVGRRDSRITDLRTAAFLNALNKVATSYLELGIFP